MQLLTQNQVCKKISACRTTLWKLRKSGAFPEPLDTPMGQRWLESDIDKWILQARGVA